MRDFRVATIFEGTTEIHSIYPPLSIARNFSKQLYSKDISLPFRLIILLRMYFKTSSIKTNRNNHLVKAALKRIRRYSSIFRKLFISSLLKYGKNLPEREFILRRLTNISCRIYALSALVLKINSADNDIRAEDPLKALEFYIADSDYMIESELSFKNRIIDKYNNKLISLIKKLK
jgi:acyl-CoA dehydrogenase family member 9